MNQKRAAIAAVVAIVVLVALVFGFTVVDTGKEAALNVGFDPVTYVDGVWPDVQGTIKDKAVDLAVILAAIEPNAQGKVAKADLVSVAQQYGLITIGEADVFRVKATGTVTDVDTSTSKGTLGLQVDGYDGPIKVRAYVGTRIPSDETSVRDAAGFIDFGDFKEQTEYGKVAAEINKRVLANLSTLDAASLVGKTVDLAGAMTMRTFNLPEIDVSELTIVPVEVQAR
jgi:predicted lipoprotein